MSNVSSIYPNTIHKKRMLDGHLKIVGTLCVPSTNSKFEKTQ